MYEHREIQLPEEIWLQIFYYLIGNNQLQASFILNHGLRISKLHLNLLKDLPNQLFLSIIENPTAHYHEKLPATVYLKQLDPSIPIISDYFLNDLVKPILTSPLSGYVNNLIAVAPLLTPQQAKIYFVKFLGLTCSFNRLAMLPDFLQFGKRSDTSQSLLANEPDVRKNALFRALGKALAKEDVNALVQQYQSNPDCTLVLLLSCGNKIDQDLRIQALEKTFDFISEFTKDTWPDCRAISWQLELGFLFDKETAYSLILDLLRNIDKHFRNIDQFEGREFYWLNRCFRELSTKIDENQLTYLIERLAETLDDSYCSRIELYLTFLCSLNDLPSPIKFKIASRILNALDTNLNPKPKWLVEPYFRSEFIKRGTKNFASILNQCTEKELPILTQLLLKSFNLDLLSSRLDFLETILPMLSKNIIGILASSEHAKEMSEPYLARLKDSFKQTSESSESSLVPVDLKKILSPDTVLTTDNQFT